MENSSLWQGVPNYLRELNEQLEENWLQTARFEFVRSVSFLVDGVAIMTATRTSLPDITRHVLLSLSRWKAATSICSKDIALVSELSMAEATP